MSLVLVWGKVGHATRIRGQRLHPWVKAGSERPLNCAKGGRQEKVLLTTVMGSR